MSDPLAGLPLDRPTPVSQSVFQQTYGGSLACCQIMLVFYGLSILQTWMYFIRYERDNIYLKLLVLAVFLLSTVHAIFVCHTVWNYLVFSYTDVKLLIDGEWSVYAANAVGVLSCFLVQCFFARMIYNLTKKTWKFIMMIVMATLILAQLGFGLALTAKLFIIWKLYLLKEAVYVAMIPLFCVRMASDAVTAGTLCIVLYDAAHTEIRSSVKLLKTLIIYAVNRFVLTTVVVAAQVLILIIRPDDIWAMVIEFITVHIYVNSFLATLNTRDHVREIGRSVSSQASAGSSRMGTFKLTANASRGRTTQDVTNGITITEQVHVDFGSAKGSARTQSFELDDLQRTTKEV